MFRQLTTMIGLILVAELTYASPTGPDSQTIVEKSVAANKMDFDASPSFSHTERVRTPGSDKTYRVMMLDGSPYRKLIAMDGKPIDVRAERQEDEKYKQERARRVAQSSQDRQKRIAKYEADRNRDHAMMGQLTKAFNFTLLGRRKLSGFTVYVLRATPRPGYQPPNMETQVLPAMQGMLWIDASTYQWVKVTAQVMRPASIDGFLAQVEPGTRFELEKMPVGHGIWQPKHFAMRSRAKLLFLVNTNSQEEDIFSQYEQIKD